ncbi:MAG: hypothetical protein EOM21_13145 [Gammaproteobacteria bacterium]|nr:hypothetical protein [Gammaproteobacteria bacterium]
MTKPMIAAGQIERALTGYVDYVAVAKLLGVTRQAIFKRSDRVKREMGGVRTPLGWLFDPEQVRQYERQQGRSGGRPAGPFLM